MMPSPGAAKGGKGPTKGSGGKNKRSLEGRGPTPKAEDRAWHPAGKRKAAAERYAAAGGKPKSKQANVNRAPKAKAGDDTENVTGRNSVLEAFAAKIPALTLSLAQRIEFDDRVKQIIASANGRNLPIIEITRQELDRMTDVGTVHQGVALKVPPYEYAHPLDLLDTIEGRNQTPLLVALDGVTDPRNLGAIARSAAAFGADGLVVPTRRSVGVTASAWKTSAGALTRVPVAQVTNICLLYTSPSPRDS